MSDLTNHLSKGTRQYFKRAKKLSFGNQASIRFYVPPSKRTQILDIIFNTDNNKWGALIDGVVVDIIKPEKVE